MATFTKNEILQLPSLQPLRNAIIRSRRACAPTLAESGAIYGDARASVYRGQISVGINQEAIQAIQLHLEMQSAFRAFDTNSSDLMRRSAGASMACRAHATTAADPAPLGAEVWNTACLQFFDAAKNFQEPTTLVRQAFAHIEEVWNKERQEQDAIEQASNAAIQ
jgi:hypothetical protein